MGQNLIEVKNKFIKYHTRFGIAGRPRRHLSSKIFLADLILGTSCKNLHNQKKFKWLFRVFFTMFTQLVPATKSAGKYFGLRWSPDMFAGSNGILDWKFLKIINLFEKQNIQIIKYIFNFFFIWIWITTAQFFQIDDVCA